MTSDQRAALADLIQNANRLCDRNQGGTYEEDCRRSIARARAVLDASEERICGWTPDNDADWETESWKTGCGQEFVLSEGTPTTVDMRFCTYCGGRLIMPRPAESDTQAETGGT
jgi:hypothetical protein